jgi:hypothetical protein
VLSRLAAFSSQCSLRASRKAVIVAKHGSTEVIVSLTASPGGAAKIITPYVDTISGIAVEAITQQTNPFGSASESHTPVGVTKTPDIVLSGLYDDTADVGSWTVLKPLAADIAPASVGRVLVITAVTGNTFTITVHLVKMETQLKNSGLTSYAATLRQAGAGVWSA